MSDDTPARGFPGDDTLVVLGPEAEVTIWRNRARNAEGACCDAGTWCDGPEDVVNAIGRLGERLQRAEAEAIRFREHSVLLNSVGWMVAEALGLVGPDDSERWLDAPTAIISDVERLIERAKAAEADADRLADWLLAENATHLINAQTYCPCSLCALIDEHKKAVVSRG